jgi:hypothetical protein
VTPNSKTERYRGDTGGDVKKREFDGRQQGFDAK